MDGLPSHFHLLMGHISPGWRRIPSIGIILYYATLVALS
jgi:hypothetical protein